MSLLLEWVYKCASVYGCVKVHTHYKNFTQYPSVSSSIIACWAWSLFSNTINPCEVGVEEIRVAYLKPTNPLPSLFRLDSMSVGGKSDTLRVWLREGPTDSYEALKERLDSSDFAL